jgi:signal transduction histidine kinase
MNLRTYLILRIVAAVVLCFLLAAGVVLRQTAAQHENQLHDAARSLAGQLGLQMLGLTGGGEIPAWNTVIQPIPGICAQYIRTDGSVGKNVCYGTGPTLVTAPAWFATLYSVLLRPVTTVRHDLSAMRGALGAGNKNALGAIVVSRSAGVEAAQAWMEVRALLMLACLILTVLCLLTYLIVRRALWPLPRILDVLDRIGRGEPHPRLPRFDLAELRALGQGINDLGNALEKSQQERSLLMRKIMTLQEDERRYLARELHDEFGQSLAGVNAVASSIAYMAKPDHPAIAQDAGRIRTTVDNMMVQLRGMLRRLRPQGLDEQGLAESLKWLVADWKDRCAGRTQFELDCKGELGNLPESLVVNLFRVAQECLTNAARHADATRVRVSLARQPGKDDERIVLSVEDDGQATCDVGVTDAGLGILGMRERVSLLGGSLTVELRKPSGLTISAVVPLELPQQSGIAS